MRSALGPARHDVRDRPSPTATARIAYFFVPRPGTRATELADTGRPVAELWRALLGTDTRLEPVDARLAEIKIEDPDASDQVLAAIFGPDIAAANWHTHFRTWRKARLREIGIEYGDQLDEVAGLLAEFAAQIETLGPAGYLRSTSHKPGEPIDDEEH